MRPPPAAGVPRQLVRAMFSTWRDGFVTVACIALLAWVLPGLVDWTILDAVWSVADADSCTPERGACWAVVGARYRLIFFGLYPYEEHWRSAIACGVIVLVTIASCLPAAWTPRRWRGRCSG